MVHVNARANGLFSLPSDVSPDLIRCRQDLDAALAEFHATGRSLVPEPDTDVVARHWAAIDEVRVAIVDLVNCPSAGVRDSRFKLLALKPCERFIDDPFDLASFIYENLTDEFGTALAWGDCSSSSWSLGGLFPQFRSRSRY